MRSPYLLIVLLPAALALAACSDNPPVSSNKLPLGTPSYAWTRHPNIFKRNTTLRAYNQNAVQFVPGDGVYAVTSDSSIVHYDGTKWHRLKSGAAGTLLTLWANSKDDIFVSCANSTVYHFTGETWVVDDIPAPSGVSVFWGASGNAVFALADRNWILKYDGSSWTTVHSGTQFGYGLRGLWGLTENELYMLRRAHDPTEAGQIVIFNGSDFVQVGDISAISFVTACWDIWASAPDDIYVTGGDCNPCTFKLFHFDGVAWSEVFLDDGTRCVSGSAPHNVFAFGNRQGKVFHYTGNTWNVMEGLLDDAPAQVYENDSDIYAVDKSARVYRKDGSSWQMKDAGTSFMLDLTSTISGHVYTVGSGGAVKHYDGTNWNVEDNRSYEYLTDIHAVDEDNIFAVGGQGRIVHYNGAQWRRSDSGVTLDLTGIHGLRRDYVVAVGRGGVICEFNGSSWSRSISPVTTDLHDVWVLKDRDAIAVGTDGVTLLREDDNWTLITETGRDQPSFHAVWGHPRYGVLGIGRGTEIQHFYGHEWRTVSDHGHRNQSYISGNDRGEVVVLYDKVGLLYADLGTTTPYRFDLDWEEVEMPDMPESRCVHLTDDGRIFLIVDYTEIFEGVRQ